MASIPTVALIRHGMTVYHETKVSMRDDPLSAQGRAQAVSLSTSALLAHVKCVLVSPLSRALHTALLAFGHRPDVTIIITPLLREFNLLQSEQEPLFERHAGHPFSVLKSLFLGPSHAGNSSKSADDAGGVYGDGAGAGGGAGAGAGGDGGEEPQGGEEAGKKSPTHPSAPVPSRWRDGYPVVRARVLWDPRNHGGKQTDHARAGIKEEDLWWEPHGSATWGNVEESCTERVQRFLRVFVDSFRAAGDGGEADKKAGAVEGEPGGQQSLFDLPRMSPGPSQEQQLPTVAFVAHENVFRAMAGVPSLPNAIPLLTRIIESRDQLLASAITFDPPIAAAHGSAGESSSAAATAATAVAEDAAPAQEMLVVLGCSDLKILDARMDHAMARLKASDSCRMLVVGSAEEFVRVSDYLRDRKFFSPLQQCKRIRVDALSRDTRDNASRAYFLLGMLGAPNPSPSIGKPLAFWVRVITNDWHMPRSMAIFDAQLRRLAAKQDQGQAGGMAKVVPKVNGDVTVAKSILALPWGGIVQRLSPFSARTPMAALVAHTTLDKHLFDCYYHFAYFLVNGKTDAVRREFEKQDGGLFTLSDLLSVGRNVRAWERRSLTRALAVEPSFAAAATALTTSLVHALRYARNAVILSATQAAAAGNIGGGVGVGGGAGVVVGGHAAPGATLLEALAFTRQEVFRLLYAFYFPGQQFRAATSLRLNAIGSNALHFAAEAGMDELCLDLMCWFGFAAYVANDKGITPAVYARQGGHEALAKLLEQCAAIQQAHDAL